MKPLQRNIDTFTPTATTGLTINIEITNTTKTIPISDYEDQTLTVLETTILHLRKENMKYSEIGRLLNRNERNIWTINNRMQKKLTQ